MRKTLVILLLLVFLLPVVYGQAPQSVSITQFGLSPNSLQDAVPVVIKALEYCKRKSVPKLVFPKGQYEFNTSAATKREYFISNTSTEEECPSKVKTIGILLDGMKNFTIDGNGSLFLFHGKMITFVFDHCRNITLQNISFDFARPTMSEFRIISASATAVDVKVHKDSWYRMINGKLIWFGEDWRAKNFHCVRLDTTQQNMYYANEAYRKLMEATPQVITKDTVRFNGTFHPEDYPVGNIFTVRDPIRDQVGAFIAYSKDIHLKHISMHYMHGLGIVSQFSENIWMEKVMVEPRKGSGRYMASFADGMHFSGCKGKILVEGCRFDGLHDDPINVHGTHLRITKVTAPDVITVRFMHGQTYGMEAFFKNDTITFTLPATLESSGTAIVKEVKRLSDREIQLTLTKPLPSHIHSDYVVENITWTPQFTLRNCVFRHTNTRGLLLTTRRKTVIENNVFDRTGMHAILIANDAASWFESGPVKDVLIRNNQFLYCGYNSAPDSYPIAIMPENHQYKEGWWVHQQIRIENNQFFLLGAPLLTAKSVDRLSFSGNSIEMKSPEDTGLLQFSGCREVKSRGNKLKVGKGIVIKLHQMKMSDIDTDLSVVNIVQ